MKRLRKGVLSLVTAVVLFAAAGAAYAGQSGLKAPPPDQSKAYKEVGIESLQYLQEWDCGLIPGKGGYINITGFTKAYQNVDYIMVRLYLQRWNGKSWVDLGSWPYEKYSASKAEGVKGLQVLTGYYYRTRAEHRLTGGGVTESAKSFSDAYLVN
ncbi:MAG: DUF6147 family protein [Peptococcaceae bacterium]|nr:DUF6147 family protein [Peptococcaceae bacterium]